MMALLKDILHGVPLLNAVGQTDTEINSIQIDSRKVGKGDLFVALKGMTSDGHEFISKAVEKGAIAIICEDLPSNLQEGIGYLQVQNSGKEVGVVASNFYQNPSSNMKVIGVTGTNGKTSVATLLFRLFRGLGKKCGLLSTVQNQIIDEIIPATHTTSDAINLNRLMKQMVDAGCEYCFMEVSSHAVEQHRIAGVTYSGGIFTNLTHDHLDYHKTFENYLRAKKQFFDILPSTAFALANADDRNGNIMLQNTKAKRYTYSLKSPTDFKTKIIENNISGLHLDIDGVEMHTRLIGEFNAYNITAVYAAASLLGIDKTECLTILSSLSPPEGRFDQIASEKEKIVGIIDYAHTPDALKNVLQTIAAIRSENESVITVIGCGGDRDAAKRPVMAEIACKFSNHVILTSDNPRSEDPVEIINQMKEGVPASDKKKVLSITDRREAIKTAITLAGKEDIILLAGKGHEKYQEIKGVKTHFDDKEELIKAFKEQEK